MPPYGVTMNVSHLRPADAPVHATSAYGFGGVAPRGRGRLLIDCQKNWQIKRLIKETRHAGLSGVTMNTSHHGGLPTLRLSAPCGVSSGTCSSRARSPVN